MKSHTEIHDPDTAIQGISNAFWVEPGWGCGELGAPVSKEKHLLSSNGFLQKNCWTHYFFMNIRLTLALCILQIQPVFLMARPEHLDENAD